MRLHPSVRFWFQVFGEVKPAHSRLQNPDHWIEKGFFEIFVDHQTIVIHTIANLTSAIAEIR